MKFFSIYFLILTSLSVQQANAQISVNDVILQFKYGERPVRNVVVKNSSKEVFYVSATCEELAEPSEPKSALIPTEDVLVSPKKFSIDGNNERVVRLLHRKPADDKEHVYRIAFIPQEKEFGEKQTPSGEKKAMVKVITGMGVLVFADPKDPASDLKWKRTENSVIFSNSGNQHVRLTEGKACKAEGVDCTELPTRRVYGGKEWVVEVPNSKTVYYTRRDGPSGDFKSLVIAP